MSMPRRTRVESDEDNEEASQRTSTQEGNAPIAFVSYQGPHRRTTAATRRVIHQQAMKEIGKTRRRPKEHKSVALDVSSLLESRGPAGGHAQLNHHNHHSRHHIHTLVPSWWLGVRWTLTDGLSMVAKFDVELDVIGRMLLANSKTHNIQFPTPLGSLHDDIGW